LDSGNNLTKLTSQDFTLMIGTETIKPITVVRDLGVWLESELSGLLYCTLDIL